MNNVNEQIAKQQKKIEQEKAKLAKLKNKIAGAERKKDTRRKILVGSFFISRAKADPDFRVKLIRQLNDYLNNDRDRELFGLQPINKSTPQQI
ncbi:mobilization protein [Desulfuromonas acetoxidans]|uniref:Mobilization protein n=1 Tax=Desulfuromonas acetoxidans (strain DSM 684 / 11070) TaxID=281689 RepID=Q1K2Y6_DESA6|nr:hypothetical protein [Desulfuromonas acetoxidans]EAT16745.1 hypothetical protein Dace_1997 [Desulfuromonas acetoxidans DSM 684]NVD23686.1 mobilization protein [Desulfuromonas acetoxidans]NVE15929.1 mobilization protein [Desulfuromonas acetoxidans]